MTVRGQATRERIVEVAAALVAARGASGTSIDDIIAASATSKSQLYHYFTDKDALIREVIRAQTRRVIGLQGTCLERIDSLQGLRRWRDEVVAISMANGGAGGCPVGSLASELADGSETARHLLVEAFETWETHLERSLARIRDRGDLEAATKTSDLATGLIVALQGGLLLARTMRNSRPLEVALDMAIDNVARYARTTSVSAVAGSAVKPGLRSRRR